MSRLEPLKSLLSKVTFHQEGNENLLVLVHGRTGNLKLLEWISKRFKIPGLSYLSIQAPYADRRDEKQPEGEGFSWYLPGRKGIEDSRKVILESVEELKGQGWGSRKIFWLGFSQGAAMSLDLALRGPDVYGGVLAVSGFCVQSEEYPAAFGPHAKDQSLLITHGTRDEILTLEKAESSYEPLRRYGIPFEFEIYDKPHSFHLTAEIPFLEARLKAWVGRS